MAFVTFLPSKKRLKIQKGISLFDAISQAGLPIASSCSGDAVCGKCNVQVVAGGHNISDRTEAKSELLVQEKHPNTDRISCLVQVEGDCSITTRYW